MTLKVYGYLRISGAGQLDGNGFDRQKDAINAFALKSNMEVVHFYEEQVSGVKDEEAREVFQLMISDILRNGVRTIIVEGLDRLAREYRIQEQLLIYLASKEITLIDARTGEDITSAIHSDPMKKALIQIQGIFSELEKNLLVKKLRTARQAKRQEDGKCEGRKGYDDYPDKRDALANEIKSLRRKPRGGKRMAFTIVADELNNKVKVSDIYSTISGKPWTGPMVQNFIQRYGK